MKKTDQFELPFEGKSSGLYVDTCVKRVERERSSAEVVSISELRLKKHVGSVYSRLVERGFGALPERKR